MPKHMCLHIKLLQEHKYKAGELLTKIHKLLFKTTSVIKNYT